MFLNKKITTFTDKSSDKLERVKIYLQEADAVIIGAGAGLSISAGFDESRVFYTQGDYGLFQCSKPCHNTTYDNEPSCRPYLCRG